MADGKAVWTGWVMAEGHMGESGCEALVLDSGRAKFGMWGNKTSGLLDHYSEVSRRS